MSTQTIKNQPLVAGRLGTGVNTAWLRRFWARLLAGKKKLFIGGGMMAAVMLAGFFSGAATRAPRST